MSMPRKKIWTRLLAAILLVLGLIVALIWSAPAAFVLEQLQSRFGIRVEEYSIQKGEGAGKVTARIILLDNI